MKRRTLFKTAALAILGNALPRFARAQARAPSESDRGLIAAIAEVVLPSTLGADGRAKAVAAFTHWLDGYEAGVPMSYGYGDLRYAVVPPSPLPRYRSQFARLRELSKARGSKFAALSLDDRKAVVQAALLEAKVTKLPERPDGQHVASDLMSHFYNSSDGNDFLFKASIRVSQCRGLDGSADRPASIA
jgi:Gluconate 2-dehydrogenase subunit 3